MNKANIIQLKSEDYKKCQNIWDMSKQPSAPKWYDELISGNRTIFVYQLNGEYIGEGALVFDTGDSHYTIPNQRIYLSWLFVKEDYRGQGIGGKIVDHLIENAKQLGFDELSLGVDCNNEVARHLYTKKGFNTILFQGVDEAGAYVKLLKEL